MSTTQIIWCLVTQLSVNIGLEGMWKEPIPVEFKLLSWRLPGGIDRILTQDSRPWDGDYSRGRPGYEGQVLTTQKWPSVSEVYTGKIIK